MRKLASAFESTWGAGMTEYWYRYDETHYAPPADEYGEYHGKGSIRIHLNEYTVIRRTPKGVWLSRWPVTLWLGEEAGDREERFVLKDAWKRFACPTKEEAQASFIARKKRQLKILRAQAEGISDTLCEAREMWPDDETLARYGRSELERASH